MTRNMTSKKRNESGLGKSLLKKHKNFQMHYSEEERGGNLMSVAISEQENQIEEFLGLSELAGTTFTAEKIQSSSIVAPDMITDPGIMMGSMVHTAASKDTLINQVFCIPRRPLWDSSTTKEEFHKNEEKVLLEWQMEVGSYESVESAAFERNIHVWRQLWSVIDKSDIVVQIVDARNPLLFRCKDLEKYVTEVDPCKLNMILMSKSDLLNDNQRKSWLEYFQAEGIPVAFWSSKLAEKVRSNKNHDSDEPVKVNDQTDDVNGVSTDSTGMSISECTGLETVNVHVHDGDGSGSDDGDDDDGSVDDDGHDDDDDTVPTLVGPDCNGCENHTSSNYHIKSSSELLKFFRELFLSNHSGNDEGTASQLMTVGMVGYPNVGKSSTINTLLKKKVVPVSNTPGKTKHLQTILVEKDLLLCDCPGLVFPNPISTKAEMFCYGILPIDQLKDHRSPISWICSRIPREVLEDVYGIALPSPREGEQPDRPPSSDELLCAYGRSRGYMITKGVPDQARSARQVLKDFINGNKLLNCEPPPGLTVANFNSHLQVVKASHDKPTTKKTVSEFDENYFTSIPSLEKIKVVHVNSEIDRMKMSSSIKSSSKKHNNKHKRKRL